MRISSLTRSLAQLGPAWPSLVLQVMGFLRRDDGINDHVGKRMP